MPIHPDHTRPREAREAPDRGPRLTRGLRGAGFSSLLVLLASWILAGPGTNPGLAQSESDRADSGTTTILEVMGGLENQRDPKCHTTFCRLEDFLNGTPLMDDARILNVDLQQALVRGIWAAASRAAAASSERTVGASRIQETLARFVEISQDSEGAVTVKTKAHAPVVIPQVRVRQYGSVAYSFRAILGVQQAALIAGDDALLPLRADGVEAIRAALDRLSLSALTLADRRARELGAPELNPALIQRAWDELLPPGSLEGSGNWRRPAQAATAERKIDNAAAMALLREFMKEKITAYYTYNNLTDPAKRDELLLANIERFYTLHSHASSADESAAFGEAFLAETERFTRRLLEDSAAVAIEQGHELARLGDAYAAVERHFPHTIDDFEDLHLFPRLPAGEKMRMEAYDGDSMRDFGIHWVVLGRALEAGGPPERLPDPFACEIIAETVSNYELAVLRVAGQIAKQAPEARVVLPDDIVRAARSLEELAVKNHETPTLVVQASKIVSAPPRQGRAGELPFADATEQSRVVFEHRTAPWLSRFRRAQTTSPPTFSGGGIAAEDVEGDGDVDLLFVGGEGNALLLNDGKGRFTNVTRETGISPLDPNGESGEARQPLIADFDNDGLQDILITYVNDRHRLYRNTGKGRFEEATESAGLGGPGFIGGSATTFDFDGDGLLDLYVCNFGNYLAGALPYQARHNDNGQPNQLFRNEGNLRFSNVTAGSGADDTGWCQEASHTDFDRDGRQDIVVANDFGRDAFLRNLGGGRFENVAPRLGVDTAYHGMNVGISDLNADSFPDIYISNITMVVKDNKYVLPSTETQLNFNSNAMATAIVKESDELWMSRSEGGRLVAYVDSDQIDRGVTSTGWAWDAEFFDYDLDGDDDLYVVNGSNPYFMSAEIRNATDHRFFFDFYANTPNVFFVNEGGKLRNAAGETGADYNGNSRSTAYLDLEGDGDLDIALNDFHSPAKVLGNRSEKLGNNWAKVRLVGNPEMRCNRDAIGAILTLTTAEGIRVMREIQGGSGFLSMNPKEQHFGLGGSKRFDLKVTWPCGVEQSIPGLKDGASQRLELPREPDRAARD